MVYNIIMNKLIKILHITFFTFAMNLVFSVETINAPFISKINLEVSNGKVLLTWKNPEDFNDNITIYRSNSIIDSPEKINNSEKIIILKNKEEKYIDIPDKYGNFYYAIIITDKSSNIDNIILVPYRNYTIKPATISQANLFNITKINSESDKAKIKINWDYNTESKNSIRIMLYRNTTPINNKELLDNSIKIATLDIADKMYFDIPIANIDYYYAIFIEDEKEKEYIPDVNITVNPVSIEKQNVIFPEFSIDNFIPLPLLTIKSDPKSGKLFLDPQILKNPSKIDYSKNTEDIINNYKSSYKDLYEDFNKEKQIKLQHLGIRYLNNEEIFETQEYSIEYKNAIKYMKNNNIESSLQIFEELIKEILPDELQLRVSYYIGIIYYIKGNYYMSYIYLNYAYDNFKKEITPYLNSIYFNIFESLER